MNDPKELLIIAEGPSVDGFGKQVIPHEWAVRGPMNKVEGLDNSYRNRSPFLIRGGQTVGVYDKQDTTALRNLLDKIDAVYDAEETE